MARAYRGPVQAASMCVWVGVCALRLKVRGLLKWPCEYGNVTIDRLVQFGS